MRGLGLPLLLLLTAAACRGPGGGDAEAWYAFGGPSALPQVGVSAGGGRVVARSEGGAWGIEAEGTFQFLDDSDFLDDGRPASGDFTQVRVGARRFLGPDRTRAGYFGFGLAYMDAEAGDAGEPLILEPAGDYYGVYGQLGFLTRLSDRWSIGPELRLFVVGGHGVQVVPQLVWQLVVRF